MADNLLQLKLGSVWVLDEGKHPVAERPNQSKQTFIRCGLSQYERGLQSQRFDRSFNRVENCSLDIDLDSVNTQAIA